MFFFDSITNWQLETFPQSTALSSIEHLKEELEELKKSIEAGNIDPLEVADCFMLLYHICKISGMNKVHVGAALSEKFRINLSREWGVPNEKGYTKHITK